ncbi:MAG: amidohydrolase family protein [Armatimonadota bacterium]
MKRRTFLLGALLPAAALARGASAAPAADDLILIRDARLVPVSGPVVQRGSLLLRGGRIAALGANVAAPAGARVIDGAGLSAYPGMIETDTQLGLSEISSVRATVDAAELGDLNPQLCAFEAFHPHSELIPVTRANGVTTVLTRPSGGTVPGQAALMNLAGWTAEEMAARPRAGLVVRYPRGANGAQLSALKTLLKTAGEYQGPKPGEPVDLKLTALQPYVKGELPVLFEVNRKEEIEGALALTEEYRLRSILSGVLEADQVTKLLKEKQAKCLVGSILSQPSGTREAYDQLFALPAALHEAGIPFALVSGDTANARNLPYHAAMAISYGLPADAALRAVTLAPAEILGVEKDYGSLAVGKVGNLFLATGDPFDPRTQVKHLFIQGRPVDLDNRHEALYRKFLQRLSEGMKDER